MVSVQASSEFQWPVSEEMKDYPQIHMKLKEALYIKNNFLKGKFGGLTYYKAMVIKSVEYFHMYMQIDQ